MRRRLALGPSAFSWQKICFYLADGGLIEYDNLCVTVVYPAALLSPPRTENFNTFDQRMWKYLKSPLAEWSGLSWVALYSTVLDAVYTQARTWKMHATLLTSKIWTLLKPKPCLMRTCSTHWEISSHGSAAPHQIKCSDGISIISLCLYHLVWRWSYVKLSPLPVCVSL